MNIPNWKPSPNRTSIGFSQIAVPTTVLPKDDRTDFLREGITGSSMFAHDFDHKCRGRRIQKSGQSDFGILSNLAASSNFPWVQAEAASAACPSQPRSLATTSITFAALVWDADEPCSVKTAQAPESSCTMSPCSTTLPSYF